jgi:two-component system phosphate regulon sensor histidine kinase PhoR
MASDTSPLASLLNALAEPALIVLGGRVEASNAAARSLLGRSIDGRDLRLAIRHPLALEAIAEGKDRDLELIGIGTMDRPVHLSIRTVGDESLLVRMTDRSATVTAERMRTDFVANASHELRTPLAAIIGYSETLADDAPLDQAMRARFGGIIQDEARRMLRIVEDLMSLSRIEAGRFELPSERIDLGNIVRRSSDDAQREAERQGCRIEVDTQPDVPAILGDPAQLAQLTDNLIGNAIRYGCPGHGNGRDVIEVSLKRDRERLVLAVVDHGDGIAADHLPRLTERFYRVDPARSRGDGGTGLGLAIVKHIVERHRGTLEIRSSPGHGTQVLVALPID